MCVCVCVCVFVLQSCSTLCNYSCLAPLSIGFSRQEYWSGLPFPSPGHLPNPGIEPNSPTLQADSSLSGPPGKSRAILATQQKAKGFIRDSLEAQPRLKAQPRWAEVLGYYLFCTFLPFACKPLKKSCWKVWKDSTCRAATKPMCQNYWAHTL